MFKLTISIATLFIMFGFMVYFGYVAFVSSNISLINTDIISHTPTSVRVYFSMIGLILSFFIISIFIPKS